MFFKGSRYGNVETITKEENGRLVRYKKTRFITQPKPGRPHHVSQQDRLDLWRKYHKRISRALSPLRGGQFLQVENQMALFIDLNIAEEMPPIALGER